MKYINQHSIGVEYAFHKGKRVVTSSTSNIFQVYYKGMDKASFAVGTIPAGYEHRPDLISNLFYNQSSLDWFICYFNNIIDPFNQLNIGDSILIPNIKR